jgi:hypothetical protein
MARVVKHHLVGWVMQKRSTAFHRLKNPAFTFDTQRLSRNAFLFGYPAHQRFRLMDIQVVEHEMPLHRLGIAGNQALEMCQCILLGACGSPGRFDDVPRDDIKVDEPGQNAMPDKLSAWITPSARLQNRA